MSYYSKLASMCAECPNVDACDHKRMEACALMELPTASVNVIANQEQTEIAKKKILNKSLGCNAIKWRNHSSSHVCND